MTQRVWRWDCGMRGDRQDRTCSFRYLHRRDHGQVQRQDRRHSAAGLWRLCRRRARCSVNDWPRRDHHALQLGTTYPLRYSQRSVTKNTFLEEVWSHYAKFLKLLCLLMHRLTIEEYLLQKASYKRVYNCCLFKFIEPKAFDSDKLMAY